jgi:hypothetical protein
MGRQIHVALVIVAYSEIIVSLLIKSTTVSSSLTPLENIIVLDFTWNDDAKQLYRSVLQIFKNMFFHIPRLYLINK